MKTILITGGTGLVGFQLSKLLTEQGYSVTHLSRKPTQKTYQTYYWDPKKGEIDEQALIEADAIIHLAGAGVADRRWSAAWKKEIYDSRVGATKLLRERLATIDSRVKQVISASAIGFYGLDSGAKWVDESTERGSGFLADVVEDWEAEAHAFADLGVTTSLVRIGIVLSNQGGALVEMARPIRFGIGAPLGSGSQFMSWIHIDDLCRLFTHVLKNELSGTYNAVAPEPQTNKVVTQMIAKALKRPIWLPNVPKFALQILVGEMASILVGGNRVSSKKIQDKRFNFRFALLENALDDLLK